MFMNAREEAQGCKKRASRLGTKGAILAPAALALMLVVGPPAAQAAAISVNTTADELNSDGDCSLREAVQTANTNAAVDACPAGDATPTVDVIDFSVAGTITLASTLPSISEAATIDGPGASSLTISGNGAVRVLEVGATLNLAGVTISDGLATGNPFNPTGNPQGGAIFNNGTLTLSDAVLSTNSAPDSGLDGFGGGIYNSFGSSLTVTRSAFYGNEAGTGGFGDGGAIYSSSALTTVVDSTFSGNTATDEGGGIDNRDSTVIVSGSTFSGNSTSFGGAIHGAISDGACTITVTNSTVSGNAAGVGGGFHNGCTLTITNSTLSGNSAGTGGGIFNYGGTTLKNTIVASSLSGANCAGGSGGYSDGGGNLSWPDATCPGLNTDPMLDPAGLQDNGGPTETVALKPSSPAINTALPANCPATDQRGIARPQGAGCDMGAFELVQYPRPGSATPNRQALVVAYKPCTDPNRTHGAPFDDPSCTPPAQASEYLTTSPLGKLFGFVKLSVLGSVTPAIDADVKLTAHATDVRLKSDQSDYAGELQAEAALRITDLYNGPALDEAATVADRSLSFPVPCLATADTARGSTCSADTSANALYPGVVVEGKRAIWDLGQVRVYDGGPDGLASTAGNTLFLASGVFIP